MAATAQARYAGHHNFQLLKGDALDILPALEISGLNKKTAIIALETMEHIKAVHVVRLLECIAAKKPDIFICSVPVEVGPAILLKNLSAWLTGYDRDQEYTWSETLWASIYKLDKIPVHSPLGKGHKGFDWRWLTQTIRYNMEILGIYSSPFAFLPSALSVSMFIVAAPKLSRSLPKVGGPLK